MAEAKKTPTKKTPVAADKRKAADDALEARIAARKTKSSEKAVEASPVAQEEIPFAATPAATDHSDPKPVKEKRKAVRKPKAEPTTGGTDVSGLVSKIEARVSAKIEKVHSAQVKAMTKDHAATVKQLKAENKSTIKLMVTKAEHEEQLKKAYEAGVKAGQKAATKAISAALKGR